MLDEALLVVAYRRHVGRPERSALVAGALEGRRGRGAGPVAGGHPVVAGARGDPQLAAGERRVRRGRELSRRRSASSRWSPTSTAGTGTSARRSSSASTTCPRSASTSGSCPSSRSSPCCIRGGRAGSPPRERLTWYVVGLFGLLLALGSNTPLEHLFNSLPLYGHQRLQSRNMITVATAVCVLFAGWIDRTDTPRRDEPDDALRPDHGPRALRPRWPPWPSGPWPHRPRSLHVFAGVPANVFVVGTVREATLYRARLLRRSRPASSGSGPDSGARPVGCGWPPSSSPSISG